MSLLVIFGILGLFVNTMTADDKYTVCDMENVLQPIQMQFSEKKRIFSDCFAKCLKSTSNFQNFKK